MLTEEQTTSNLQDEIVNTNGDKIRNMSNTELSILLHSVKEAVDYPNYKEIMGHLVLNDKESILEWLESEE